LPIPDPRSAPDRCSPLLKERIRSIFKHLPKALTGDEEAIHQMRVAGRRLRVALPLLAPKPEGRRVKRALGVLRGLTRAAGTSRDLDVSLEVFEERLKEVSRPTREQRLVRGRLRGARTRSRSRMVDALLDLEIAAVRRDLRKIVARPAADVFTSLARLRDVRDREGDLLLAGFLELADRLDPVALHALRRRARRLRYAAEVNDVLRGEESDAPDLWKQLQDRIGGLHDRHVLAGWLDAQATAAERRGKGAWAAAVREERAHVQEEIQRLHQELLDSRPTEIAGHALEAMGRTRPAA
jgi:CHAD domain-containing protein